MKITSNEAIWFSCYPQSPHFKKKKILVDGYESRGKEIIVHEPTFLVHPT